MSAVVDRIDVDALIPDGIEPVEAWRTWSLSATGLQSHNATLWTPGEPLVASCPNAAAWTWTIVKRGGLSLVEARAHAASVNNQQAMYPTIWIGSPSSYSYMTPTPYVPVPSVEPPAGHGYKIERVTHDAPHVGCSCGIYAATVLAACPAGEVLGKVKLWGQIIPGDKGYRAQYAYPSEFHVPAKLAGDPRLTEFGVPITVSEKSLGLSPAMLWTPGILAPTRATDALRTPRRILYSLAAANLLFSGWDLLVAFGVLR